MAKDDDSLDFTRPGGPKPGARRSKAPVDDRGEPQGSRRFGIVALVAVGIGLALVLMVRDDDVKEPPAPPSTVKADTPLTPPRTAQPYPPPTKLQTPAQPAPQGVQVGAIPPEFLKVVQAYNTKAGFKAIALALDADGKWAYGSVSGASAQQGANDEALAECAKFSLQSGARSACKLFAVGDKIVW